MLETYGIIFGGLISGKITTAIAYIPDPPTPCSARQAIKVATFWAKPPPIEKATKMMKQATTVDLRPRTSLRRVIVTAKA